MLPTPAEAGAGGMLARLRAIEPDQSAFLAGLSVAVSAGIATPFPNVKPDTRLARTDNAPHASRAQGRNRTTIA